MQLNRIWFGPKEKDEVWRVRELESLRAYAYMLERAVVQSIVGSLSFANVMAEVFYISTSSMSLGRVPAERL